MGGVIPKDPFVFFLGVVLRFLVLFSVFQGLFGVSWCLLDFVFFFGGVIPKGGFVFAKALQKKKSKPKPKRKKTQKFAKSPGKKKQEKTENHQFAKAMRLLGARLTRRMAEAMKAKRRSWRKQNWLFTSEMFERKKQKRTTTTTTTTTTNKRGLRVVFLHSKL